MTVPRALRDVAADSRSLLLPDGRRLAHHVEGDPTGLPVLWHDGTPGSRVPWVVPTGVRLLTFDRPGSGASDPRPGQSLLDVAEDVRLLLDHLGWPAGHLVGFSNGGPHALATAAHLGRRVLGVIGMGSASPFTLGGHHRGQAGLAPRPRRGPGVLPERARGCRQGRQRRPAAHDDGRLRRGRPARPARW